MRSRQRLASEAGAVLAVVLLSVISGCNTSGCLENRNSLPLAGFYSSSTGNAITIDSVEIGGVGAPNDTLLATARYAIKEVYLPFRSTTESTSFFVRYVSRGLNNPELYDTLTFGYTSEPRLMSEECGIAYLYHINYMSHTSHLIDSVAVTDSTINNQDLERIRIYFRTSNP